jgi:hypothetical protein
MDLKTLFDQVSGQHRKNERARAKSWQDFIVRIADGKENSASKIAAELEQFGRSPEELAAAVDRLTRRREAAAAMEKAKGADHRHSAIEHEIYAATQKSIAEQAEARQRCAEIVGPRQDELIRLERARAEARTGESFLIDTCDPELKAEVANLETQLEPIRQRASEASAEGNRLARLATDLHTKANIESVAVRWDPRQREEIRRKADSHSKDAEAHWARAQEIEAEARPIQEKIAELHRKMLLP